MATRTIDINCDLGESFGNWQLGDDAAILGEITTANVACGFHAGDPVTQLRTVAMALERGVAVGAHPGLPDLLGFGRRKMAVTAEEAAAYVTYQVGTVREALRRHGGGELHHVKPHGALLASIREDDPAIGRAMAEAIFEADPGVLIYWIAPLAGDPFAERASELGLRVVGEVYPDLAYDDEGQLLLQRKKEHTPGAAAVEQLRLFLETGEVRSVSGKTLPLEAESVCVHGDGPNATEIAAELGATARELGFEVAAVPRGEA